MIQYPGSDEAQLQNIMSQNPQFLTAAEYFRRQSELLNNTENIRNTFFEYGKFLLQMDEAGKLLKQMLGLKTIHDTVEVIRCYKLL